MINYLLIYLACILFVSNIIAVLEYTNLKVYILSLFIKEKIYTLDDLHDYIIDNWGKLGELLSCPLCYGTWLSLLASLFCCWFFNLNMIFAGFSMFSVPSLACLINKKIK